MTFGDDDLREEKDPSPYDGDMPLDDGDDEEDDLLDEEEMDDLEYDDEEEDENILPDLDMSTSYPFQPDE